MTLVLAAGTVPAYPVHLTAEPRPDHPSRGLWLVKWILVIPHGIVLALLWAAFLVLSVVAFVAILVTERYPRAIFDFNVGVLRWSWRVAYYSYGALGTDRYPPFTLQDVPDYPVHLDVDYPERLSRGLVLVKWWLLALPHYLIVAVLTSNGLRQVNDTVPAGWAWETSDGVQWAWQGGGLIALLALVAGLALLFTGRYPQGLYDLLIGLNRWVLRVAAYAGLMTDTYPPFRLDQGGGEELRDTPYREVPVREAPDGGTLDRADAVQAITRWTTGGVMTVVAGSLAVLLGLGLMGGGAALMGARQDGWVTSPTRTVQTDGYAVATQAMVLEGVALDEGLGEIRVRAENVTAGDIFVGIARAADAANYLAGVEHSVVTGPLAVNLQDVRGDATATPPEQADVWVDSASGPGLQSVEITAQPGSWVVVVMATDGSAGLRAHVDVAATLPWLTPAGGVLLAMGVVLLLGGAAAVALAVRAASTTVRE
ncbi:DUF4389 domain-containing protein [Ornithinimicrobium sp. LYQ103]|uniref:DUF4389 domain-containing protein n=1 Tax=Ornithinimicrobium sp. LYQ103 TaxID=3378796 RepID=UPI003851AEEA